MNNLTEIIESVKLSDAKSVADAANRILIESDESTGKNRVKVGDTVAVPDDDEVYPGGTSGKVKAVYENGWADVEWPNGVVVKRMISLLYPIA